MSRINFAHNIQGHRLDNLPNNDLDQKLTYQQLINMNHDLAKENMILQDTTRRLGQQLSKLHSQFDIKPRQQNVQLYNAIGAHPILYQYQTTLIPLLDAYENKIQQFQGNFETIHEQFFTLEKKFEEICKQNESLKSRITDLNKQLIDVYKNQGNQKMHSDFGQIILDQINQKQRSLVDQNARLESESQKYKSLSERIESQNESLQRKLDQCKSKLREVETKLSQLEIQNKNLNSKAFELQIKVNETEAEKRKLEQAHERAQSQNNQLNKEKQIYLNNLETLKSRVQGDLNIPVQNDQGKLIEQLQTKIAFLEAGQGPSDEYKKLQKLRKDFDELLKEKQRLKQSLDNYKIKQDGLKDEIAELRSENSKVATEKSLLQKNESKINKSLEVLKEKSKNDINDMKKRNQEDLQKLEFEYKHKIELKDKKISELDDAIDKVRLERDRLEKENIIYGKDTKQKSTKDSERTLTKMKQKFIITQELFKEQLSILENDLAYRKKQAESNKKEIKDKTQQLNKLRAEFNELKKLYEQVSAQKDSLVSQFKRVRDTYEDNLKSKESLFNQKIVQVKNAVKEAEKKRRDQRDNVKKVISDQKRVLDQMRVAYEGRIRQLESQPTHTQYIHKEVTSTIK